MNESAPYHLPNTSHTAGEGRRQVKNLTHFVKNVKIVEFHNYIWNQREKCIQISTNMPSIGLVISEIAFEMQENQQHFAWQSQWPFAKC